MERVKAKKEDNEIILSFNDSFYDSECIKKAVEDFRKSCDIKETEEGLILSPKDKKDFDIAGYEFYNYVLGLMKNR